MIFPDFRIFSKPWYKTIAFICLIFGRLLYGFWFFVCKSQTHKAGKTTVLRGDVATYSLDWNWVTPFTVHTDVGLGSQVSSGLPATVIKFTIWGIRSSTTRIIRHRETSSFQLISSFLNVFCFFTFCVQNYKNVIFSSVFSCLVHYSPNFSRKVTHMPDLVNL